MRQRWWAALKESFSVALARDVLRRSMPCSAAESELVDLLASQAGSHSKRISRTSAASMAVRQSSNQSYSFDPPAGNFPTAFDLSNDLDSNPLSTPTFLSHSKDDNIVPFKNGEMLCQRLRALSMTVTWKGYEDEGHWVNQPEGLNDLNDFIKEAFRSTEHQERSGT